MTHNQIAAICREVVMVRLGLLEKDIPGEPWEQQIYNFATSYARNKTITNLKVVEEFGKIVDQIIGPHPTLNTAWLVAYQRHHNHYVNLFRQGKITHPDDKRHYEIAVDREKRSIVRPLPPA